MPKGFKYSAADRDRFAAAAARVEKANMRKDPASLEDIHLAIKHHRLSSGDENEAAWNHERNLEPTKAHLATSRAKEHSAKAKALMRRVQGHPETTPNSPRYDMYDLNEIRINPKLVRKVKDRAVYGLSPKKNAERVKQGKSPRTGYEARKQDPEFRQGTEKWEKALTAAWTAREVLGSDHRAAKDLNRAFMDARSEKVKLDKRGGADSYSQNLSTAVRASRRLDRGTAALNPPSSPKKKFKLFEDSLVSGARIIIEDRGSASVINNRNGYVTVSFDSGGIITYHISDLV